MYSVFEMFNSLIKFAKSHVHRLFRYCDAQGLPIPRAQCDPGYVCYKGAYIGTPTDGVTGRPCPEGTFCVTGSYEYQSCSPGTYSKSAGATNNQDCQVCDPGYYCSKKELTKPEGPCNQGYYCPAGSRSPNETLTPKGYFTPDGASDKQPCLPGTYQPHEGKSNCLPCPNGYYCPTKNMSEAIICPAGFYCPIGSEKANACPEGTYSNYTREFSNSSCKSCPPGKYCNPTAQTYPTGKVTIQYIMIEKE